MKIREQRVDDFEIVRWVDKDTGFAHARLNPARCIGSAFKDSDGRCADRDDAAVLAFGVVDDPCDFRGYLITFLVHGVVLEGLGFDGCEGAGTYMKRDITDLDIE